MATSLERLKNGVINNLLFGENLVKISPAGPEITG